MQNKLENLGGKLILCILDQGKAYHQIRVSSESHHLIAFITHEVFISG